MKYTELMTFRVVRGEIYQKLPIWGACYKIICSIIFLWEYFMRG